MPWYDLSRVLEYIFQNAHVERRKEGRVEEEDHGEYTGFVYLARRVEYSGVPTYSHHVPAFVHVSAHDIMHERPPFRPELRQCLES